MSLMWIPAQTTRPPLRTAFSATGTKAPTGAKMIAQSSSCGGDSSDPPAQLAPSFCAKTCPAASPDLVKAETSRPCHRATWAMMWCCGAEPIKTDPFSIAGQAK